LCCSSASTKRACLVVMTYVSMRGQAMDRSEPV
jgi:hypothetical protein